MNAAFYSGIKRCLSALIRLCVKSYNFIAEREEIQKSREGRHFDSSTSTITDIRRSGAHSRGYRKIHIQ